MNSYEEKLWNFTIFTNFAFPPLNASNINTNRLIVVDSIRFRILLYVLHLD